MAYQRDDIRFQGSVGCHVSVTNQVPGFCGMAYQRDDIFSHLRLAQNSDRAWPFGT